MDERKPSGRYQLHIEGEIAYGFFGSDKDQFHTWRSWEGQRLDPAEIKRNHEWYKKRQRQEEAAQERKYKRNAAWLTKAYSGMAPATSHPYGVKKGLSSLPMARIRRKGNILCLPIVYLTSRKTVWGLQQISERGDKWFIAGSKKKGGFIPLAGPKEDWARIYICEGYSTGVSIREATSRPVICAVDAGNIQPVAEAFRAEYPDATIIIAADNDQWPSDKWPLGKAWINTGVTRARAAAGKIGAFIAAPEFEPEHHAKKPTDWNDYACIYGSEALKSQLEAVATNRPQEARESQSPDCVPPAPPPSQSQHISSVLTPDEERWLIEEANLRKKGGNMGFCDKDHSAHNALIYLSYHPKWAGTFVYDEFAHEARVIKALPWDNATTFRWRTITDMDLTQLRALVWADSFTNMKIGSNKEMKDILDVVARRCAVHPVRDYFNALRWDGEDRLYRWIAEYCRPTGGDPDYMAVIGACFFKAAVKRIFVPGTFHKQMLVLEGAQDASKSTLFRTLATFNGVSYFTDAVGFKHIDNPYLASFLSGKLIVEFAELDGMTIANRTRIKGWITQTDDVMQPKHKMQVESFPRQYVLAGSTNEASWMNDPTGGVRFWPVRCGDIDIEGIEAVKEQLWAEAVARVKSGELHYIPKEDEVYKKMLIEQAVRYEGNIWDVPIAEFVKYKEDVTTEEVLKEALFIDIERWTRSNRALVCDCLRGLGFQDKSVWDKTTGKTTRKWVRAA